MAHPLRLLIVPNFSQVFELFAGSKPRCEVRDLLPPFFGLPPVILWCCFSTRGRSAASNGLAHQGVCWVAALPLALQDHRGEQAVAVSQAPSTRPPTMLLCHLMSKPICESLFIHKGNKVRNLANWIAVASSFRIHRLLVLGIWGNLKSMTTLPKARIADLPVYREQEKEQL